MSLNVRHILAICCLFIASAVQAGEPVEKIYGTHCASCHGVERLGGIGPALLPENLERLRRPEAMKTIAQGNAASQMVGFSDKLSKDDIEALVYSSEIDKTQAAALKPGDKLQVKIIKVDVEGMKIGVSARL